MNFHRVTVLLFLLIFGLTTIPKIRASTTDKPIQEDGEIIASLKFNPAINGFSFANYARRDGIDYEELTAEDLILLFGAENVCIEGSDGEDCVLYETAERWLEERLEKVRGGRCDGFSAGILRLFNNTPFKGRRALTDWQTGAKKNFDLTRNPTTENYVTFFQLISGLKEANVFRAKSFKMKPSEILKLIIDAMKTGKDPYTLEVWIKENGKYTIGHAIVPIAVEDMGEGEYRIHIYDPNFPAKTRFLNLNAEKETWSYSGRQDPQDKTRVYSGTATSSTLALKKLSDRNYETGFECPFCEEGEEDAETSHAVATSAQASLGFSLIGQGDILITDPNGKRIGYDFNKKQTVNEISGATEILEMGGLGEAFGASYILPFNPSAKKLYTITISGKSLKTETDADIEITGPGFVVGFEGIMLDAGESLTMTVSSDGRELSFTASADGETPEIFITTEDGPTKPSYEFEIGGITLSAGKTITVKLEPEKGRLHFKDDDGDVDKYDIAVARTNADGTENVLKDFDVSIGDKNSFVLEFGTWDGKGKMKIKDDDGS